MRHAIATPYSRRRLPPRGFLRACGSHRPPFWKIKAISQNGRHQVPVATLAASWRRGGPGHARPHVASNILKAGP